MILFNRGNRYTKGGAAMELTALSDVVVSEVSKDDLPWLQLFNTGYRVTTDNIDWSGWNGCVYSDIDSKHYYNECRRFDADRLCGALYEYLLINENYNFYCLQLSHSKTSFHVLFYFDVEKTEENFRKCAQVVQDTMKEAFCNIGAKDIFEWPKVNDGCSRSPLQGMFLTGNPILYGNHTQPGFGSFEDIDSYEIREPADMFVSDVKADGTRLFELRPYKKPDRMAGYRDHHQRWAVYDALIAVFGERERVGQEWEKICSILPEENGHTRKFYMAEPGKNRWFERYSAAVSRVNVDVLKEFGYSFERLFEPVEGAVLYTPDLVYELEEGQRLGDITIDWDRDRINHLFAGCSLGKTYNAKRLGQYRIIDDIDWIFGERQTKVCFVSPMKSINKDSFEGADNWIIVDGDHKFENICRFDSIQKALDTEGLNICTTWESYCAYEMWNAGFDYVIVDEVHTFYMYDYRLRSINDMKKALNASKGIRIIMTATPSYELREFDCKKIRVKKKQTKVDAEIVLYDRSFKGHYMTDILEWTKDRDHYAVLFDDRVNYKTEDSFRKYGLECSVFNTNYQENVEAVLAGKNVLSQISAFSVYGQAGINLYIDPDKKVRIYVMNSGGIGIIQYANRIRKAGWWQSRK